MTSTNLGSIHSSCYYSMEDNEDQHKLRLFGQEDYIRYNSEQYHQGCYHREQLMQHQVKAEGEINSRGTKEDSGLKVILCKKMDRVDNTPENNSVKWMSSKMRMMKKMQNSGNTTKNSKQKFEDPQQASSSLDTNNSISNNSLQSNNLIRVCTDCNTTKTPLWRSGPNGPKSLCNACGIRQRKARIAMAAAAAGSGTILEARSHSMKSKVQNIDKKSSDGILMPFKKRFKVKAKATSRMKKKICFEDLKFNLGKHSALQEVFYPQDEKEGAILLMALSNGLVQG